MAKQHPSKLVVAALAMFSAVALATASWEAHADPATPAIDPGSIIGIEAIVAAGSDAAIYSRFGHAMLRFVKADGNFASDLVVSFEANTPANQISAMKGLDGGYSVVPDIKTFGAFWKEYVTTEERPLDRYVIPSNPDMRARLIGVLEDWIRDPSKAGKYTFLKNNCVGALAKLFEKAGFPSSLGPNPIIPTHLDKWLKESLLSPFPALEMQSPKDLYERAAGLLGISTADFMSGSNWPANAAEILSAQLSDADIKRILIELPNVPESSRNELAAEHRFGNGGADLDQVITYEPVSSSLYETCSDASCASDAATAAGKIWSASAIRSAVNEDRFVYWLVVGKNDPTNENLQPGDTVGPEQYNEPLSFMPGELTKIPALVENNQLFLRAETAVK